MKFLKRIQTGWQSMTTTEKVQLVLSAMAQIGGGLIGADIAKVCAPTHGKLGAVCVHTAGFGLGLMIGDASAKAIEKYISATSDVIDMAKEVAAKEEEANG